MYRIRILARIILGLGLLLLGVGIALAAGSAILAGDWWLAREPWIGIGLTFLVAGLAIIGMMGLLLDFVEPIGRVRVLAIPGVLLTIGTWFVAYTVGVSRACCGQPDRDIRTLLYSQPEVLALLIAATLAILLPLVIARRRLIDRQR